MAVYLVSYDRTQELGLTLLGRVPSLLCIHTPLVCSYYYHNIHIYSYVSTLAFYATTTRYAKPTSLVGTNQQVRRLAHATHGCEPMGIEKKIFFTS